MTQTASLPNSLELQLKEQRRRVDFDTFDIFAQQLVSMLATGQIWMAPAYQRKFRWQEDRASKFIESLFLGIPVPTVFMATNPDNTWEVVDGVQRLTAIVWFAGDKKLREALGQTVPLVLQDLKKLKGFNSLTFDDLPPPLQQHFNTRPVKVVTLNDKSDKVVRYDLFERLNTGGVVLSPQEIRNCIFQGQFASWLTTLANSEPFSQVVRLTDSQKSDGTLEECVLRFFAFLHRYRDFDHYVKEFLNGYMEDASKIFDYEANSAVFTKTFRELARVFPNGIHRAGRKGTTPLNLYEGLAVGAALALQKVAKLRDGGLPTWLASPELKKFTTGATNDKPAVRGRIEFCRDRFTGKAYVPTVPAASA